MTPSIRDDYAAKIDQVNALVHDAYRVAVGVLIDPATADRDRFHAGVRYAREGVALLATVTPKQPEERWLEVAIMDIERGAAHLQRCADLLVDGPVTGDALARLLHYADQAEGNFDHAWQMIAGDT